MAQDDLLETVETVEATWGRRYERELREIYEDESLGPVEKFRQLVGKSGISVSSLKRYRI